MTHAVVRGRPTPLQECLENIIVELIRETGRPEDRYSLSRLMFKRMRDNSNALFMIEGISEQRLTNGEMLQRAVQAARALQDHGVVPGDTVFIISWNNVDFISLYLGCLFAGIIMLNMETIAKPYEIANTIKLKPPKIFFSEEIVLEEVRQALKISEIDCPLVVLGDVVVVEDMTFSQFVKGHSDMIEGFWPPPTEEDETVMMFLTSGTTGLGLPKICLNTHKGFVSQNGCDWTSDESLVPQTNDLLIFLIYSAQWTVHLSIISSAVMFGIPLLMQTVFPKPENLLKMIRKYKPTKMSITPVDIAELLDYSGYKRGDLDSILILVTTGSAVTSQLNARMKAELTPRASVRNTYGMTEVHGFVCLGDDCTTVPSVGRISNVLHYKLVDEQLNKVTETYKHGELRLKSDCCLIKRYLNDETATAALYDADGWFCTGDIFYFNEKDELFFVDRKKFIIMHNSYPMSPFELEQVVCDVPGVLSCVVCGIETGPAALVVLREGCTVTKQQIYEQVKEKLNEYKQLSGGIAFVKSLPKTCTGKILRMKCKEIAIELLMKSGI